MAFTPANPFDNGRVPVTPNDGRPDPPVVTTDTYYKKSQGASLSLSSGGPIRNGTCYYDNLPQPAIPQTPELAKKDEAHVTEWRPTSFIYDTQAYSLYPYEASFGGLPTNAPVRFYNYWLELETQFGHPELCVESNRPFLRGDIPIVGDCPSDGKAPGITDDTYPAIDQPPGGTSDGEHVTPPQEGALPDIPSTFDPDSHPSIITVVTSRIPLYKGIEVFYKWRNMIYKGEKDTDYTFNPAFSASNLQPYSLRNSREADYEANYEDDTVIFGTTTGYYGETAGLFGNTDFIMSFPSIVMSEGEVIPDRKAGGPVQSVFCAEDFSAKQYIGLSFPIPATVSSVVTIEDAAMGFVREEVTCTFEGYEEVELMVKLWDSGLAGHPSVTIQIADEIYCDCSLVQLAVMDDHLVPEINIYHFGKIHAGDINSMGHIAQFPFPAILNEIVYEEHPLPTLIVELARCGKQGDVLSWGEMLQHLEAPAPDNFVIKYEAITGWLDCHRLNTRTWVGDDNFVFHVTDKELDVIAYTPDMVSVAENGIAELSTIYAISFAGLVQEIGYDFSYKISQYFMQKYHVVENLIADPGVDTIWINGMWGIEQELPEVRSNKIALFSDIQTGYNACYEPTLMSSELDRFYFVYDAVASFIGATQDSISATTALTFAAYEAVCVASEYNPAWFAAPTMRGIISVHAESHFFYSDIHVPESIISVVMPIFGLFDMPTAISFAGAVWHPDTSIYTEGYQDRKQEYVISVSHLFATVSIQLYNTFCFANYNKGYAVIASWDNWAYSGGPQAPQPWYRQPPQLITEYDPDKIFTYKHRTIPIYKPDDGSAYMGEFYDRPGVSIPPYAYDHTQDEPYLRPVIFTGEHSNISFYWAQQLDVDSVIGTEYPPRLLPQLNWDYGKSCSVAHALVASQYPEWFCGNAYNALPFHISFSWNAVQLQDDSVIVTEGPPLLVPQLNWDYGKCLDIHGQLMAAQYPYLINGETGRILFYWFIDHTAISIHGVSTTEEAPLLRPQLNWDYTKGITLIEQMMAINAVNCNDGRLFRIDVGEWFADVNNVFATIDSDISYIYPKNYLTGAFEVTAETTLGCAIEHFSREYDGGDIALGYADITITHPYALTDWMILTDATTVAQVIPVMDMYLYSYGVFSAYAMTSLEVTSTLPVNIPKIVIAYQITGETEVVVDNALTMAMRYLDAFVRPAFEANEFIAVELGPVLLTAWDFYCAVAPEPSEAGGVAGHFPREYPADLTGVEYVAGNWPIPIFEFHIACAIGGPTLAEWNVAWASRIDYDATSQTVISTWGETFVPIQDNAVAILDGQDMGILDWMIGHDNHMSGNVYEDIIGIDTWPAPSRPRSVRGYEQFFEPFVWGWSQTSIPLMGGFVYKDIRHWMDKTNNDEAHAVDEGAGALFDCRWQWPAIKAVLAMDGYGYCATDYNYMDSWILWSDKATHYDTPMELVVGPVTDYSQPLFYSGIMVTESVSGEDKVYSVDITGPDYQTIGYSEAHGLVSFDRPSFGVRMSSSAWPVGQLNSQILCPNSYTLTAILSSVEYAGSNTDQHTAQIFGSGTLSIGYSNPYELSAAVNAVFGAPVDNFAYPVAQHTGYLFTPGGTDWSGILFDNPCILDFPATTATLPDSGSTVVQHMGILCELFGLEQNAVVCEPDGVYVAHPNELAITGLSRLPVGFASAYQFEFGEYPDDVSMGAVWPVAQSVGSYGVNLHDSGFASTLDNDGYIVKTGYLVIDGADILTSGYSGLYEFYNKITDETGAVQYRFGAYPISVETGCLDIYSQNIFQYATKLDNDGIQVADNTITRILGHDFLTISGSDNYAILSYLHNTGVPAYFSATGFTVAQHTGWLGLASSLTFLPGHASIVPTATVITVDLQIGGAEQLTIGALDRYHFSTGCSNFATAYHDFVISPSQPAALLSLEPSMQVPAIVSAIAAGFSIFASMLISGNDILIAGGSAQYFLSGQANSIYIDQLQFGATHVIEQGLSVLDLSYAFMQPAVLSTITAADDTGFRLNMSGKDALTISYSDIYSLNTNILSELAAHPTYDTYQIEALLLSDLYVESHSLFAGALAEHDLVANTTNGKLEIYGVDALSAGYSNIYDLAHYMGGNQIPAHNGWYSEASSLVSAWAGQIEMQLQGSVIETVAFTVSDTSIFTHEISGYAVLQEIGLSGCVCRSDIWLPAIVVELWASESNPMCPGGYDPFIRKVYQSNTVGNYYNYALTALLKTIDNIYKGYIQYIENGLVHGWGFVDVTETGKLTLDPGWYFDGAMADGTRWTHINSWLQYDALMFWKGENARSDWHPFVDVTLTGTLDMTSRFEYDGIVQDIDTFVQATFSGTTANVSGNNILPIGFSGNYDIEAFGYADGIVNQHTHANVAEQLVGKIYPSEFVYSGIVLDSAYAQSITDGLAINGPGISVISYSVSEQLLMQTGYSKWLFVPIAHDVVWDMTLDTDLLTGKNTAVLHPVYFDGIEQDVISAVHDKYDFAIYGSDLQTIGKDYNYLLSINITDKIGSNDADYAYPIDQHVGFLQVTHGYSTIATVWENGIALCQGYLNITGSDSLSIGCENNYQLSAFGTAIIFDTIEQNSWNVSQFVGQLCVSLGQEQPATVWDGYASATQGGIEIFGSDILTRCYSDKYDFSAVFTYSGASAYTLDAYPVTQKTGCLSLAFVSEHFATVWTDFALSRTHNIFDIHGYDILSIGGHGNYTLFYTDDSYASAGHEEYSAYPISNYPNVTISLTPGVVLRDAIETQVFAVKHGYGIYDSKISTDNIQSIEVLHLATLWHGINEINLSGITADTFIGIYSNISYTDYLPNDIAVAQQEIGNFTTAFAWIWDADIAEYIDATIPVYSYVSLPISDAHAVISGLTSKLYLEANGVYFGTMTLIDHTEVPAIFAPPATASSCYTPHEIGKQSLAQILPLTGVSVDVLEATEGIVLLPLLNKDFSTGVEIHDQIVLWFCCSDHMTPYLCGQLSSYGPDPLATWDGMWAPSFGLPDWWERAGIMQVLYGFEYTALLKLPESLYKGFTGWRWRTTDGLAYAAIAENAIFDCSHAVIYHNADEPYVPVNIMDYNYMDAMIAGWFADKSYIGNQAYLTEQQLTANFCAGSIGTYPFVTIAVAVYGESAWTPQFESPGWPERGSQAFVITDQHTGSGCEAKLIFHNTFYFWADELWDDALRVTEEPPRLLPQLNWDFKHTWVLAHQLLAHNCACLCQYSFGDIHAYERIWFKGNVQVTDYAQAPIETPEFAPNVSVEFFRYALCTNEHSVPDFYATVWLAYTNDRINGLPEHTDVALQMFPPCSNTHIPVVFGGTFWTGHTNDRPDGHSDYLFTYECSQLFIIPLCCDDIHLQFSAAMSLLLPVCEEFTLASQVKFHQACEAVHQLVAYKPPCTCMFDLNPTAYNPRPAYITDGIVVTEKPPRLIPQLNWDYGKGVEIHGQLLGHYRRCFCLYELNPTTKHPLPAYAVYGVEVTEEPPRLLPQLNWDFGKCVEITAYDTIKIGIPPKCTQFKSEFSGTIFNDIYAFYGDGLTPFLNSRIERACEVAPVLTGTGNLCLLHWHCHIWADALNAVYWAFKKPEMIFIPMIPELDFWFDFAEDSRFTMSFVF